MLLRGQEEAPIELLIGIIMFVMVSVLALQVTTTINNSICNEKITKSQEDIASNLKSALTGSEFTVQTFKIQLPTCPDKNIINMTIQKITDKPKTCQRSCKPLKDTCWMTVLEIQNKTNGELENEYKCINISPETKIITEDDEKSCSWDEMKRKTNIKSKGNIDSLILTPAYYTFTFKRDTSITPQIKVCIQ